MSWREPGSVLVVSCYELGHQPFTIASAWAQLEDAGFGVTGRDAALEGLDDADIARARLVAISVPMHTALRLGTALAQRVRAARQDAHVCFFGLYASLNAEHLLAGPADSVIGGEFETALVGLARALAGGTSIHECSGVRTRASGPTGPVLRRLPFVVPRRDALPALDRYARLVGLPDGEQRVVGYVEASRGCLHMCRHCPVTPIYEGRFFVVPREIVLADADQQIAAGARHITFGDPDFLNGPGHSLAIARELSERHPGVTFDVTAKVEHLLRHAEHLPALASAGCLFVVTAVESFGDRVLVELDKGHTRDDAVRALRLLREHGIAPRPTFVPFSPWATLADYVDLCEVIVAEDLVDHVDPIQLAIRLLVPPRSALLRDGATAWLGALEPGEFGHRWSHPDARMDALHADVTARVQRASQDDEPSRETFAAIRELAWRATGREPPPWSGPAASRPVPRLTEPWFCCAEPSIELVKSVTSCGTC